MKKMMIIAMLGLSALTLAACGEKSRTVRLKRLVSLQKQPTR